MRQEVYDDPYGLDAWDRKHSKRCFVTIANSTQWMAITGERPPTLPPSARHYTEAGLPWFEWYGGDAVAVDGAKKARKSKAGSGPNWARKRESSRCWKTNRSK